MKYFTKKYVETANRNNVKIDGDYWHFTYYKLKGQTGKYKGGSSYKLACNWTKGCFLVTWGDDNIDKFDELGKAQEFIWSKLKEDFKKSL